MSKITRNLLVLVGVVTILSLTMAAVGPVFAQTGSGGNNSVALQSSDTLGTLVTRYQLNGTNLRSFFSENQGLVLKPGQTVTFPSGVNVNLPVNGNSSNGSTTSNTANSTATPEAITAASAGTATPTATTTTNYSNGSTSSNASTCQTYVTQNGDTLGKVLGFIGFVPITGTASGNSSSNATSNATTTPVATVASPGTATPAATLVTTGTPAATSTTTGTPQATQAATATATTAANYNSSNSSSNASGNSLTDTQLQDFVNLNPSLSFTPGQTAILPAGIAVTGNNNANGNSNSSNSNTTTYTVQQGDTLQSIANKYGITVAQLLALNPNLLTPGMTINVPAGSGRIPQTGSQLSQTYSIKNEETLGRLERLYNLGLTDMTNFFTANCNVTVVPGQTVLFPIAINNQNGGSTAGNQQFTYVTKQGDTLCSLINMMGLNLSQGSVPATGSNSSSNANATATPAATSAASATPAATSAATETPAATSANTATPAVTATRAATTAATGTATSAATSAAIATSAATTAAPGTTTPAATSAATETPAATSAVTATPATTAAATGTATPAATSAATATPAATAAATGTATPAATTAANTSSSNSSTTNNSALGAYANNQNGLLREFFKYNRGLKLENGQSISLSGVIPATGGALQSSTTGNNATSGNTTTSNASGNASSAASSTTSTTSTKTSYSCNIPAGRGLYRIGKGETIFSVALKFGVTVQQILDLNPGRTSFSSGDVIMMPGVEAPGLWNTTALGCNDAHNVNPNSTSR